MTHPIPPLATRHADPGRIHELARLRATQLRREAQAQCIRATASAARRAARAVWVLLTGWVDRPQPVPPRSAGSRHVHRPCA